MYLIAFEGIDASGKETQASLLQNALTARGYRVMSVSFPRYNTHIGQLIKGWLLGKYDLSVEAFHMLLEADRQDFMRYVEVWERDGFDFLILDRFTLSNLAFGMAKGLDVDWLISLQKYVRKPDITFVLDITAETSRERKGEGRDRHEADSQLLSKARTAYQILAERLSKVDDSDQYIVMIDADQAEPKLIHEAVMSHLESLVLL